MNTSLTPLSLGDEIVAIVPAQRISWHQVQLPAGSLTRSVLKDRSAPRVRALLEGLLEEQLLDDTSAVHFALQPAARDGAPVWVAVCDRRWLHAAVEELQQAGTHVQRLVPEWAPGATESESRADTLWITGTPETAVMLWVDDRGVHRLPLSLAPLEKMEFSRVWAEPAVAGLAEQTLHREVEIQSPEERWRNAALGAWDLAQFDLVRRSPWMLRLQQSAISLWRSPQWKAARWSVLALALVQVVGLNAYAWHVKSQLEQQRVQIRNTLTTTFPQVSVVVDAPLQMERELAALRQASGSVTARDLEFLLSGFGSIDPQSLSKLSPKSIDFSPGVLRLGGLALGESQLETLAPKWYTSGVEATQDGDALVLRGRSKP
jgi:general secretion pathway protein L